MTVEIINLQGGASGSLITRYTDTLLAPDQPVQMGDDWFPCGISTGLSTVSQDQVATRVNRGINGVIFTGGGGGSLVCDWAYLPAKLNYQGVWGKAQFAEWVFVSDTSIGANCNAVGLCVWCRPNDTNGYNVLINPLAVGNQTVQLRRTSVASGAVLGAVRGPLVANDVLRIEIRELGGGNNELKMLINSIVTDTVIDNTQFALGLPGIAVARLFTGAQTTVFKNFDGGKS